MRLTIYLFFLMFVSISLHAHSTLLNLVFNDDRPNEVYILEDLPRITFDNEGGIIFEVDSEKVRYSSDEIRSYNFSNVSSAELVEGIISDDFDGNECLNKTFFLSGNILRFPSAAYRRFISLHNLNGLMCYSEDLVPGKELIVDLEPLNGGIYILTINNSPFKIIIR